MPSTVKRLTGEPIIVVTIEGRFDPPTVKDTFRRIAELLAGMEPPDRQPIRASSVSSSAIMT